ncbi:Fe-S cluster assembly sulfur transfer protein SufU [Gryllotalpicola ginsengisoli]|uniref:Fe-S cluster assembly sulfur transfer protein SufU n=1 Tax=Gryllotalpicola ginsengisoli TaxID=444608 RepID=UPI0003B75D8C|nr:SUF system NifU family Fe-S cluster assembly protein [Gryllotalpicola ginsengisoli]
MSDELQDLYRETIMDHARAPHHFGLREPAAAESHQLNPTCGDEVTVRLHLSPSGDRVESLSWEGHGCAISQASASLLSDLVHDLEPAELTERIGLFRDMMRSRGEIAGDDELLGDAVVLSGASRYLARVKCAMLSWVAVEDALAKLPQAA